MKKLILIFWVAVVFSAFADTQLAVTKVEAQQRYPWNGLVDVTVTLQGSAEDVAKAECSFAATNGATKSAIPIAHITQGGVDSGTGTVWTRKYVWDAAADIGKEAIPDVVLTVSVAIPLGGVQLWKDGPYWAECNIGATKPEEYGYYFWWGDTVGYAYVDGHWNASDGSRTEYYISYNQDCPTYGKGNAELTSAGFIDSTGALAALHDAATVHLGASWRMPTDAEFTALVSNCTVSWETRNGVSGKLVTGKGEYSTKSIFLPAAGEGSFFNSKINRLGTFSYCWSSTPKADNSWYAWELVADSGYFDHGYNYRSSGLPIRPVMENVGAVAGTATSVTTHLAVGCAIEVKSVTAQQRYPWNGLVDVVVTIQGAAADVSKAECSFAAINNATKETIPVSHITRNGTDTGSGVVWIRRFIWNAAVDVGEIKIDDIALTVDAKIPYGGVQLWENGPYWAECNVGATKPGDSGFYYCWGDSLGYKLKSGTWNSSYRDYEKVTWISSKGTVMSSSSTPFVEAACLASGKDDTWLRSYGYIDSTGVLTAEHDAATTRLGAPWRIPTVSEFKLLVDNCDTEWTKQNGVYGQLVKGKGVFSSKSIFLPAAGVCVDTRLLDPDTEGKNTNAQGYYWSSNPSSFANSRDAGYLYVDDGGVEEYEFGMSRHYGHSVRPVRDFVAPCVVTTHFVLDYRMETCLTSDTGEELRYDASWVNGGAFAEVYDGDSLLASGSSGCCNWVPKTCGEYVLKLKVYGASNNLLSTEIVSRSLPHIEVVTTTAKAATCTENGCTKGASCSRCNAALSVSTVIPALGHQEVVTVAEKSATCTAAGCTKGSYCSRCSAILFTSQVIPLLGHDCVTTKQAIEPTCTTPGQTAEVKCSRCSDIMESSQTLAALGHVEVITTPDKEPTCTEAGCTKGSYCSRCNAILSSSQTIAALGHDRKTTIAAVEPTCTADGCTAEVVCMRCGVTLETSTTIPSHGGHVSAISKPAVEPTSSQQGMTAEIKCSRCGEVLQEATEIPALGYIRNVTARQLWPFNTVEIVYELPEDVHDEIPEEATALIKCKYDDVCFDLDGVVGDVSSRSGVHRVIWTIQSGRFTENEKCDSVVFDVMYGTRKEVCGRLKNLVHRWTFDGTYVDSVGLQSAQPSYEGVTLAKDCCQVNGNLFNWASVNLGSAVLPHDTGKMTLELWAEKAAFQSYANLVSVNINGLYYYNWFWNASTVGDDVVRLEGSLSGTTSTSVTLANQTKYCFVVQSYIQDEANVVKFSTYDGATGDLLGSCQLPFARGNILDERFGNSVRLGHSQSESYAGARASYYDVRIWNDVLSHDEVVDHVLHGSEEKLFVSERAPAIGILRLQNPLTVSSPVEISYSPGDSDEVAVWLDDEVVFSSTDSGAYAWQPLSLGTHTLKHIAGSNVWTRTVNVTSLAFATPPAPNPPTAADANITIGTTAKDVAQVGLTYSVTTKGSGTWSATASDDWITFPTRTSGNAGVPLVVRVTANSGVEERVGYVYIGGHVHTITQAGVGAELSAYAADVGTDGGSVEVTALAAAGVSWNARPNADWLSVSPTSGTGEGTVTVTVAPWNDVSTRSGTVTVAGRTFTVNQTGRRMKLDKAAADVDWQAHVVDVTVTALDDTAWSVGELPSWVSVVDAAGIDGEGAVATQIGGGTLALAINENPSYVTRSGEVKVGTETLTILQGGRPKAALEFSINPERTTASVKGANGLVAVTATPDLPWTAKSEANWLTIMPGFCEGSGNGNVVYTASPNTTMAERAGTITVTPEAASGLSLVTHTVMQPAATAMVSEDEHTFAAKGDSFDVEVSVGENVGWTVTGGADWIDFGGTAMRYGPGRVTVAVSENPSVDPREAMIVVAGHEFKVVQPGRALELEYESIVIDPLDPDGGYGSFLVIPDGDAQWVASTSDQTFIYIWAGDFDVDDDDNVYGMGYSTLEYVVGEYVGDGEAITGWIQIGDKRVYITQRAYDLSISPSSAEVVGNAGEGEVSVPATAGQVWNAISTVDWIDVISGDAGTGRGTVRFRYADNNTGVARTGVILIAGEEYEVRQAARQLVEVKVRGEGEGGAVVGGTVGGAGVYDRGAKVTLTAVAADGYEFVGWTGLDGEGAVVTQNPLVLTADVDKTIAVSFRRIPMYAVNGETVRGGTVREFAAPEPQVDGATKLVCKGTSAFPEKGTSFRLKITEDVSFEWDLWETNYLLTVGAPVHGKIMEGGAVATTHWVKAGEAVTLTAVADNGYVFFRWTGMVGADVLGGPQPRFNGNSFDDGCGAPGGRALPAGTVWSFTVDAPTTVGAVFGVFNDTLSDALDAKDLVFTTGGDAAWRPVVDASASTGYTSVRSGAIGKVSETWIETTVSGPGALSFDWRVDCEKDDGGGATWDRLTVFVNGVETARIDGKTGWQRVTLPVSGKATIRWSFYRDDWDENAAAHENCGWIDGVRWKENE